MAPDNRAWIRGKMANIKKTSGIAFSEEIFLSMLICLIAKNKHLVLHTEPNAVSELKAVIEQHSAIVFGLTTATIVCHGQQTRADIIGAITGRHTDIVGHANLSTQSGQYHTGSHLHHHPHHHSHHSHQQVPSGQYYQYSNPADEYIQRSAKLRLEKSRRSIATNHSEASDYSFRPYEHNAAPSIASFKTTSERDQDVASIRRGHPQHEASDYSRGGNDDSSLNPRYSESRPKSTDAMADHIISGRARKSANISLLSTDQNIPDNSSGRRIPSQLAQPPLNAGGGSSITSGKASVTPVDFTFPRRRHESLSNAAGYGGPGGEASGVTYTGRKIAQAIILDDLENASQEVYATLLEMIVTKEINDKNRYVLPDLIIIAVFGSPNIPDKIPKQLLDYFAINGIYQPLIPQLRIQPVAPRRHALFRRTDWEELSKRMKVVTVSNDMMRYIRDVIVAVRTHEAVHGGLTTRAALDLEAIIKTLAAIFQTTFVTPDLLVIAAEKVFSHRLELKSTRRRKLLSASNLVLSSSSTSSLSLPSPTQPSRSSNSLGKTPMRGFQGLQNSQQPSQGNDRRSSTSSDKSSTGSASFVEYSDSDEQSSSGSIVVNDTTRDRRQGGCGRTCDQEAAEGIEDADEKTAADVVQDVLRAVYPPI